MVKKKVSIVVVSLNTRSSFLKTINSIISQSYANKEIIVVDGNSTDGTIKIIKKMSKNFSKIIIDKDRGIYDAMNKGIALAKGEWTIFLNSGDVFKDINVLKKAHTIINKKSDIVFGNTIIDNKDIFYYQSSKFFNNSTLQIPFCHQSVFIKTKILKKNRFNLNYKICSDFNLFIKLYKKKHIFQKIELIIAIVTSGGLSDSSRLRVFYENFDILKKNKMLNGKTFSLFIIFFNTILTKFIKFFLPKYIINLILKMKYYNTIVKYKNDE